ncbi:hypothetical protein GYMLUDRAFT_264232 [Collybiopsis luxurians FD-317 M1]|uniref:F-actin-capping protein subunit beta n=1 Tax=Collybiopsis luxurians FD-317 M1 TaxID=944289 RepID=A0A0D0BK54_9AGAR|nr:hypothetical protein GYMLUDRAFT_264232 [Collybiopsis luxurians FD-317 M1]
MADLVDSMLDLMRRLPPTRTEENISSLISICPDYADDLLGSVDQPLQLKTDRATGREYLALSIPRQIALVQRKRPVFQRTVSTPKLRKLEISPNETFDTHRKMYYEGGVSSVYLWDLDDGGLAGVVLLKKMTSTEPSRESGTLFTSSRPQNEAIKHITSTIMLQHTMRRMLEHNREVTLGDGMTRQTEQDRPIHN